MKKIEATIRPEKFDDVKKALTDIGIVGLTTYDIEGRGRGGGMTIYGRTGAYTIDMLPRKMLMIVLSDHNLEAAIDAIKKAAFTGEKGDGVIFVYPVEDVIRISTNERGSAAIQYQGDIDSRTPSPKKK